MIDKINKDSKFIIIQDTHFWHKNIRGRRSYIKECAHNLNLIREVIDKVKECAKEGTKIYLIFLGDVFHRSIDSPPSYNAWVQTITALRSKLNGIYTVVGNHEMTYAVDNPFWGLINEVRSPTIRNLGLKHTGALGVITLVDHIDVYNTRIHFNHYGTQIYNISNENNVLMAHDYWSTKEIINSLAIDLNDESIKKYSQGNQIQENCVLRFFDQCFFGHNHMLKGLFDIHWDDEIYGKTTLHYLSSLGLTNRREVVGTETTRTIPVLSVDKEGTSVEEFTVELLHMNEEVLDKEEVSKSKKKYKRQKTLNNLIRKYVFEGEDPVEVLRNEIINDKMALDVFDNIREGRIPEWITKYTIY